MAPGKGFLADKQTHCIQFYYTKSIKDNVNNLDNMKKTVSINIYQMITHNIMMKNKTKLLTEHESTIITLKQGKQRIILQKIHRRFIVFKKN